MNANGELNIARTYKNLFKHPNEVVMSWVHKIIGVGAASVKGCFMLVRIH